MISSKHVLSSKNRGFNHQSWGFEHGKICEKWLISLHHAPWTFNHSQWGS
jgi:hypothetical protein